jgi:hypothetical protein
VKSQQADNSFAPADGVFAVYENTFSKDVTFEDANKMDNISENLSIIRSGKKLSIEKRPLIDAADTIFLSLERTTAHNYQFDINPSDFNAPLLSAYLLDTYTGASTPVSLTAPTTVNFIVNSAAGSYAADRFMIVFRGAATLPVNYTSVKAYQQNAGIQVDWNIATESNLKAYEVERSTDGRGFTKAGSVTARYNNNAAATYNWFDAAPLAGNNFYRIKAVENGGAVKYSSVVKVFVGRGKSLIVVTPNPVVNGVMNLQFQNQEKGTYNVRLFNNNGQQVYALKVQHAGGSSAQTLDLPATISKGVYQLQISNGEQNFVQKIICN